MKLVLVSCFALVVQIITGQNPSEPFTQKQIDSIHVGNWNLKGSDYDSRFEFRSVNDELNCKIVQYIQTNGESSNIVHNTKVTVVEKDSILVLKWDDPLFFWNGRIDKIKARRLLVEINGNVLKFVKTDSQK